MTWKCGINNFNKSNIEFIWSSGWEEEGTCREVSAPEVAQATGLIRVQWTFKPRALSTEKQEKLWKEERGGVFMRESAFSLGLKGKQR